MSAAREKDQADFDLERFIDMFDEAMTSRDPRVIDALRGLMITVVLTRPESSNQSIDRDRGPLRRLYEDMNHLNNRLYRLEDEVQQLRRQEASFKESYKYNYDYSMEAAKQVAAKVDQDVLNQFKAAYRRKIQGLK